MVPATSQKRKYGALELQRYADALFCSKSHLSRVLSGKRESASLKSRYQKLKEAERAASTKATKPQPKH